MTGAIAAIAANAAVPLIGFGEVRHRRLRPKVHSFRYRTYFVMLPLRSWGASRDPVLPRNRFGLLSFHDADHGDGGADALGWLDRLLVQEGIEAPGEIWLQCYPRVLGYAFKPVSFWYCQRADETLAAIVVEVNNTFGGRHCYVLRAPRFGAEITAPKALHVSPFATVSGSYRFRFLLAAPRDAAPAGRSKPAMAAARSVVRVDHHDADGALLQTSLSGTLTPLTASMRHKAFFGTPLMTTAVILRIHWQALRLWLKGVPFFGRTPPAPVLHPDL